MKRNLAILGSTGSIGTQALEVVSEHPDLFEVYALTANNQVDLLINQARKYMPEVVVIANEQKYPELKSQFGLVKIEMLSVYAFRDFAEALNTADEQEKLKAKQAEQQAAEAEAKARAEAERAAADSVAQAAAAPAVDSTSRSGEGEPVSPTETADSGEASQPAPAQVPATTDDPNKVQVKIPVQVPVQ